MAEQVLVCQVERRWCAFPLGSVIETMRPLPIERLDGVQDSVLGVAVIRGEAVPVVALRRLLGDRDGAPPTRFITIRAGERTIALAVDAVVGVRALDRSDLRSLPALLAGAASGAVEAIGAADRALLLVLETARLVPGELLQDSQGASR